MTKHRQTRPEVNTAGSDGCDPTRHHEPTSEDFRATARAAKGRVAGLFVDRRDIAWLKRGLGPVMDAVDYATRGHENHEDWEAINALWNALVEAEQTATPTPEAPNG